MTGAMFFVPGIPAPQGSKRAFVVNGRPVLTESAGDKLKAWRSIVTYTAVADGKKVDADAIAVYLTFWLPRPKTAKKRERPHVRPDLDKLCRSTLDGLKDAGIYDDDAQVVTLLATKHYAISETGCVVKVQPA